MKQRLLSLLLILGLTLPLAACTQQAPEAAGLTVATTVFPYYDFARVIGGQRVKPLLLVPPGREVHSFEPTPKDVIHLSEASVLLYNGGEGELWVEEILASNENPAQIRSRMMDFVPLLAEEDLEEQDHEGHDHDHDHDEEEEAYDEHIWLSPVNALALSAAVCEALTAADPAGRDYYRENLTAYQAELTKLDEAFRAVVAGAAQKTLLVADRFPLLYFCETYGLSYRAAFSGCASDTEPSLRVISSLIDQVEEAGISAVYHLELSSAAMAEVICETTGAKPLEFHSCQNISREDFDSGLGYLDLMRRNVAALKEGLA